MKEVTIIGKGEGWQLAPQDGEVWGVNEIVIRRYVSLAFNMHNLDDIRHAQFVAKARVTRTPVVSLDNYPLNDIVSMFGISYFTNSIDYMVAYAIFCGYEAINIYGVNVSDDEEYKKQKSSMEFWIGVAIGRGVKVQIYGPSLLLKSECGIYGYNKKEVNNGRKENVCIS